MAGDTSSDVVSLDPNETRMYLAFLLVRDDPPPSWLDRCISSMTGHYTHVELAFRTREHGFYACSVSQEEGSYLKPRNFRGRPYTFCALRCTADQSARAWNYCMQQANKPFDMWGAYLSWSPLARECDERRWFCSQLCMAALQQSGVLEDEHRGVEWMQELNPGAVTPWGLFALVTDTEDPEEVQRARWQERQPLRRRREPLTHWTDNPVGAEQRVLPPPRFI